MTPELEAKMEQLADDVSKLTPHEPYWKTHNLELRKGFKYGFTAATEILLPIIQEQQRALEFYIENCEVTLCEYIGEYPQGGYKQVLIDWDMAKQALEAAKKVGVL